MPTLVVRGLLGGPLVTRGLGVTSRVFERSAGASFILTASASEVALVSRSASASFTLAPTASAVSAFVRSASASMVFTVSASFAEAQAVAPPGGYVGRHQVGREVTLHVQCLNLDGEPAAPAAAPVARVYRDGVLVRSLRIPLDDDPESAGRFRGRMLLVEGDGPGRYAVVYLYAIGAEVVVGSDTFEVAAGGDPHGVVLAASVLSRPDGDAVVAHLGSGRLASGRTPYLDEGI